MTATLESVIEYFITHIDRTEGEKAKSELDQLKYDLEQCRKGIDIKTTVFEAIGTVFEQSNKWS